MKLKTLSDIPAAPPEFLSSLAGLAPDPDSSQSPPQRSRGAARGHGGRAAGPNKPTDGATTLGPLDVVRYLDHHGIAYSIKTDAKGTLYRLEECLFNPNHRREASIVQYADGRLFYQCFHNSCKGYGWADARREISGEESLAQFCEGYDPNWNPPKKKTQQGTPPNSTGGVGEDKPWISWRATRNGDIRATINTARLANHLEEVYSSLIYEGKDYGDVFYRYDESRGVWRFLPEAAPRKLARRELGDLAKAHAIAETIQLLKDQSYLSPAELESDPMILNLKDGMLDVHTLDMHRHAPDYNSRIQLPVNGRNKDAACPLWHRAIYDPKNSVFADDFGKADVLQQFFGYCLYPKILFPCALFAIGGGGNGKGLVEQVLCAMLGKENVSHISMGRMMKDFGPVEIKDKLLNACGETESGALDVTNFKKIAAGDAVQAEVKFKSDVTFTPIAKHYISMNAFPGLKEKTNSFFRRVIVLEFNQTYGGDEDESNSADPRLADKIISNELDGVFQWALEGLEHILKHDEIAVPDSIHAAKRRFRTKVNNVMLFFDEECILAPHAHTTPPDLYAAYVKWCAEGGLKSYGKQNFYEHIHLNFGRDIHRKRIPGGTKEAFYGVQLNAAADLV